MEIVVCIGPQSISALHVHVRNVEQELQGWIFVEAICKATKFLCAFFRGLVATHPVSNDCYSRNAERVVYRPYFGHVVYLCQEPIHEKIYRALQRCALIETGVMLLL